jgi:hypothetical protein
MERVTDVSERLAFCASSVRGTLTANAKRAGIVPLWIRDDRDRTAPLTKHPVVNPTPASETVSLYSIAGRRAADRKGKPGHAARARGAGNPPRAERRRVRVRGGWDTQRSRHLAVDQKTNTTVHALYAWGYPSRHVRTLPIGVFYFVLAYFILYSGYAVGFEAQDLTHPPESLLMSLHPRETAGAKPPLIREPPASERGSRAA